MVFNGRRKKAGGYARERYRRGLRSWRAKNRLLMAALVGPFVAAGLSLLILDGHVLSWLGGAISGMFFGIWMTIWESPPAYIENWNEGAEGERKTEKVLSPLERHGWWITHDVQAPYGNYDHIAVGPAGIFLLETKNLGGIVELRDGVPFMRRLHDPDATSSLEFIRPRALKAAASLKDEIERSTGKRTWVQAVVVFWSDFPDGLVDDGRCMFVHGSRLHPLLHGRPNRLDQSEVQEIASAVETIEKNGEPSKRLEASGAARS